MRESCQSTTRDGRPCSLPAATIIKIDFFGAEVLLNVCQRHAKIWLSNKRYRGRATEDDLKRHQSRQFSPEWAKASK